MPNIVEGVKGFDHFNINVTLDDLQIFDPKVENDSVTRMTKGSIFFITLASAMSLIVLISTVVVWKKSQDEIQLETMNSDGSEDQSLRAQPQLYNQSVAIKFACCFDLVENLRSLTKPLSKKGDEELEVLNFMRVMCCIMVILGNTYFYMMSSPIQNLETLQQWIGSRYFSFIISADLFVDVFFWLGAFLASYQLLMRMSINEGRLPSSKLKLYLGRMARLWPLYIFTLLFFWRFMVLFGG